MKKQYIVKNTASEKEKTSGVSEPQQFQIRGNNFEKAQSAGKALPELDGDAPLPRKKYKREFTCDEMLASITDDNYPPQEDWGMAGDEWNFDDDPKQIIVKK